MKEIVDEADVKEVYRAWLREQGAYVFSPVQMGYGQSTIDDLVCWRRCFIGIEAKHPQKLRKASPRQVQVLDNITAAGGIAHVVNHPQQVVDLIDMLSQGRLP